jgi:hypothetical protein
MYRFYLLTILVFLLTQSQQAQSFYGRYQANNHQEKLVMHLIKTNASLNAVIYQYNKDGIGRFELVGQMDSENSFALRTYDDSHHFSGELIGNEISLKSNGDSQQQYYFSETLPHNSKAFAYFHGEATKQLVNNDPFSPKATIETSVLWPTDTGDTNLIHSLIDLYGIRIPETTPGDSIISTEQKRFFEQYVRMNSDLAGRSASLNWERSQQVQVVLNDHSMLCLEMASYAFTGGAHGMANMRYLVYNLKEDKAETMVDVFDAEALAKLSALITDRVRERYAIPSNQALTDAGLFTDTIKAHDNYYLNPLGIGFYYNNYDIAPYAMGHTNIFLSFDEIKELIIPTSAVMLFFEEIHANVKQ